MAAHRRRRPLSPADDRKLQDRAVRRALTRDDRIIEILLGDEEALVDCRICRADAECGFDSNGICSRCLDTLSFGFNGSFWESREPVIRRVIERRVRERVTRLWVPCAECGERIPDPDGTKRADKVCARCWGILVGDAALDRRTARRF